MALDLDSLPLDRIAAFCERNHIVRLSVFGSALRDDFTDASDVDILVEFAEGKTPGFIRFEGMQLELCEVFGRDVDLNTRGFLSRHFRDEVQSHARSLYDAA